MSARLYYGDFSKQKFAVTGKKTPYQITIIVKIESSKCAQFELEFLQFKTHRPACPKQTFAAGQKAGVFEPRLIFVELYAEKDRAMQSALVGALRAVPSVTPIAMRSESS